VGNVDAGDRNGTCLPIHVSMRTDRNLLKKEADKILKNHQLKYSEHGM
jgi:hypothetical protein